MKQHIIYYLSLLAICFSCTEIGDGEGIYKSYSVQINNLSNQEISINGYNTNNQLEFEVAIAPNSIGGEIEYDSYHFDGYLNRADSIVVTFPNSKGYSCHLRQSNSHCFPNKNILVGEEAYFNKINDNEFEFVITQEDFDNAFDLP